MPALLREGNETGRERKREKRTLSGLVWRESVVYSLWAGRKPGGIVRGEKRYCGKYTQYVDK